MLQCQFSSRLSAYLDDQLDADQHAMVSRHIASCAACQAELRAMKQISALFAAQEEPRLSQFSLHRLHKKVDAVMEESLIRLAHVLQAVAACVLIAGSIWLTLGRPAQVQQPQQVEAAVTPVNWDTSIDETSTPASAFYLADASGQNSSVDLP